MVQYWARFLHLYQLLRSTAQSEKNPEKDYFDTRAKTSSIPYCGIPILTAQLTKWASHVKASIMPLLPHQNYVVQGKEVVTSADANKTL